MSWFSRVMNPPPLATCHLSNMCSRIIIEWKRPSSTLKQHWAHNLEGVIERPLFDSSPSLRLTQSSGGSLFTAGRMESFGEKNALSSCCKIDFRGKTNLYLFCMLIYSLLLEMKKKPVSFRKFVIKALRSMIMAFVLVFVIFAKATVVEFPQIYLYTSAVSGV